MSLSIVIDANQDLAIRAAVRQRQPVNQLSTVARAAGLCMSFLLAACSGNAERAMSQGMVAEQQLAAGNIVAARQDIAAAIDERDDLPALHLLRGRIELAGKRYLPAFDAYSAALALDATNPEALMGVAQFGLQTGHLQESEDAAERILTLQPDQTEALLIKGLLAIVRSRPAEAIEYADRILARSPGNEGGVILKARALYMRGELKQAIELVDSTVSSSGNTASLALTRLEFLRESGDAAGMLLELKDLRRIRPADFDLAIDEANLRYKTGDLPGGRKILRDALLDPARDAEQSMRIAALWREYDPEPLIAAERAQLRRGPRAARIEVARYFLDSGRAQTASELLAGDSSMPARALSARAAIAGGDGASGAVLAEKILTADRTQCDALIARSAALLGLGQSSPATVAAQIAAAECPQNPAAWLQLARANESRGRPAEAGRAFADGVLRNPQDANVSVAYVAWLERRGAIRQALGEARRLTRKTPALLSAWKSYLAVCERHPEAGCAGDARIGLVRAQLTLGIDRPVGERASNGLIGRLPPR